MEVKVVKRILITATFFLPFLLAITGAATAPNTFIRRYSPRNTGMKASASRL